MDFVTGLPKYHAYDQIFDAILMVIDYLSKKRHYIPCTEENKEMLTEATAKLFMQYIWSKEGFLISLTSDRGPQFVAKM